MAAQPRQRGASCRSCRLSGGRWSAARISGGCGPQHLKRHCTSQQTHLQRRRPVWPPPAGPAGHAGVGGGLFPRPAWRRPSCAHAAARLADGAPCAVQNLPDHRACSSHLTTQLAHLVLWLAGRVVQHHGHALNGRQLRAKPRGRDHGRRPVAERVLRSCNDQGRLAHAPVAHHDQADAITLERHGHRPAVPVEP